MDEHSGRKFGCEHIFDALTAAGVDVMIEVPGHQTNPLDLLLDDRDEMTRICARHETAIPHMAWGYYEVSGTPAATMSVPGPGDTNAMHGLRNAYDDRAPVIHISADVDPESRGQGAIHELEPETLDTVVERNEIVTNPHSLPEQLARGLAATREQPPGPVRFSIPASYLTEPIDGAGLDYAPAERTYAPEAAYDRAATLLSEADRPAIYVDNGARRSPGATSAVRELVDELNAPVFSSYKGYGVVPSDDPHFMSPAGLAIPPGALRVLESADVVLALGAYFDGPGTRFWSLPMGEKLVHVTVEPERIDKSYTADVPVVADVGDACRGILDRLDRRNDGWDGARIGRAVRAEYDARLEELGLLEDRSPAPSPAVFHALREALPDETAVVVDIGHFRTWALTTFDIYDPETIVTPGSWTGMGVGLPGAIGAKLANPDRPVVTFTGDGCLFMCLQELHTAAHYDIDVTTIVFNNSDYAIISQSDHFKEAGVERFFEWESPDFAAIAEGFGCNGRRATSPSEAAAEVAAAVESDGPELVDVVIDPDELSPEEAVDFDTEIELP